jgi:predicted amidohydrolase
VKVAAIQLNSGAEREANMVAADRLVRAAAADGAQLAVLPEKWTALGTSEQMLAAAEPLDGPALAWARSVAAELSVEIVAGSFLERIDGSERVANTCVHVDATGTVRATYRKIHMFDVDVEGRAYRESEIEEPGTEIVVSETASGVKLGLSICYDVRFPELYRILALRGALVFPLPAAFTLATTRDHWEVLLRARAIEDQAFVVAANQVGAHPGGYRSGGRSMVVDPWGVVLAQAQDAVGHLIAEIDLERQARIRRELPALANRRPRAYRWPEPGLDQLDGAAQRPAAAAVAS